MVIGKSAQLPHRITTPIQLVDEDLIEHILPPAMEGVKYVSKSVNQSPRTLPHTNQGGSRRLYM